ncbi:MAG: Magnesium transport protein CorA [Firmicutes bacterium ADurb.Bin193]|nr:MAG: Magnesium transport protein CorA [Firmicutes bacterium ADurb.Bin193]
MTGIYKMVGSALSVSDSIADDCWINLVNPSDEEIDNVSRLLSVDTGVLRAALDEEETSRVETENGNTLIIVDIPFAQKHNNLFTYETVPLGIITTEKNIITVCLKETATIRDFVEGKVKNVHINLKTRFILQMLYKIATQYLFYLKQIDKISNYIEKQLHASMKNKELIQLLDLEKSLVFFSTSLKANEVTLEKILRGKVIKLYEEDQDLLEDVLIEIKQAIEMSTIYSNILSGTMDAFASVISNNLNIVMKTLTVVTILMAIPTMIASFYGMNVDGIPAPHFWFVVLLSVAAAGLFGLYFFKKKMF